MLSFYSKLSPAQQLLISGLLSLLGTAIVVTTAATWQYYTAGQANIGVLINFAIVTFCAAMGKALYDFVPAHAQLELQALQDAENELQQALARQQAITSAAIQRNVTIAAQAQQGPLVAINTPQLTMTAIEPPKVSVFNPAPAPDVSMQNTARVPVPQMPFPEPPPMDAQPTMPELPVPDYSLLHFGDSGVIPTVVP